MNQEETLTVAPIRISKALKAMRSSETYRHLVANSKERPLPSLDGLPSSFLDAVLSTRTSLTNHSDAFGVAADLPTSLELIGSSDNSFSGLVDVKPNSLSDDLQDFGPGVLVPSFIAPLPHLRPAESFIERLLDSADLANRFWFRLFLFEHFGADPDPRLPYARELLVLFEWLLEITARLGIHRFTVRKNVSANLDAVKRAARSRDKGDIFFAFKQLDLLDEVSSLTSSLLTTDLDRQRGRRVLEAASQGGNERAALFGKRDALITKRYQELMATGERGKTAAMRIIAAESERYHLPELAGRRSQQLSYAAVRTIIDNAERRQPAIAFLPSKSGLQ